MRRFTFRANGAEYRLTEDEDGLSLETRTGMVNLSPEPARLLLVFCENRGGLFSFGALARKFNKSDDALFRDLLRHFVRQLREALRDEDEKLVGSVRGRGYSFNTRVFIANSILEIPERPYIHGISPPGLLLCPDCSDAVEFHLRDKELEDLEDWCMAGMREREDKLPIGIRLYTGPGGTGKTRLSLELCKKMVGYGWRAGFLKAGWLASQQSSWVELVNGTRPLLLVVDYAETRLDDLSAIARELAYPRPIRVRLLLLARSTASWWERMKRAKDGVGDLFSGPATGPPKRLGPLALDDTQRKRSFRLAVEAFANALEKRQPDLRDLDQVVKARELEPILFLHMEALAAVQGVTLKRLKDVLDYVLNRERRFWDTQLERWKLPVDELAPAIGWAMAVITQQRVAETHERVIKILGECPLLNGQPASRINALARILEEVYPGDVGMVEPLRPDPLGEHLVQVELERDPGLDDAALGF